MEKYRVTFDRKYTMWHRSIVEIEANSLEEAQNMLKDDRIDYEPTETEWLYDTCEYLSEEEFPKELNYKIKE